jgi:membrane-associated phospholipid phosphatase
MTDANIFENITKYSYFILVTFSLFILKGKPIYSMIFLFGYLISGLLNVVLKYVFFIPRPDLDKEKFYTDLKYKYNNNRLFIPTGNLDFPSGHAQLLFYIMIFMFQFPLTNLQYFLYIGLSLLEFYYIYDKNYHSFIACIVGALLGACLGYVFHLQAKKMIK